MIQLSRCPVCGSDDIHPSREGRTRLNFDAKRWRIDGCGVCSHEFVNPQPNWDELAPYYASNYTPYDSNDGSEAPDDEVIERAHASGEFRHVKLRPGLRLLDVGCGGGYFLRVASQLGVIAEGVEPSAQGAETAARTGVSIFHGTLEGYAQANPGRQFDLITANHVLEHVPAPVETLKTMAGLLAPGGRVWISVPNVDCIDSRKLKDKWHSSELPIHLNHFTPDSLRKAGEQAGLVLRSVVTLSMAKGAAGSLRTILREQFFIPWKVSGRLGVIDSYFGPKLASRMDAKGRGEAILVEFAVAHA
jgi:2-polyprenyl-3-methyl-5-hydroxy-6-metoxy-1,4-benzoquinol methylase